MLLFKTYLLLLLLTYQMKLLHKCPMFLMEQKGLLLLPLITYLRSDILVEEARTLFCIMTKFFERHYVPWLH